MTLAQRTLLGVAILILCVAGGLGIAVHRAWTAQTVDQFEGALEETSQRLREQLEREKNLLPTQLNPLCEHSQMVDSTLTELTRSNGLLPADRRLALQVLLPETKRAYGFDELVLVANRSLTIGSDAMSPERRKQLLLIHQENATTRVIKNGGPVLQAHCSRSLSKHRVTLIASRRLDKLANAISAAHGIELVEQANSDKSVLERPIKVDAYGSGPMFARPADNQLDSALERLTFTVLAYSAAVLVIGLVFGWLFARNLSQPIVALAQAATESVVSEDLNVPPVHTGGTKELRRLASSFNTALSSLRRLKKRLELTERIAAQREIARRVAHEIKNPLAPIQAAIETLRRLHRRNDPAFEEYFEEASRTVLDEVRRINGIVQEFTEFARLPTPTPSRFALRPFLEDILRVQNAAGPSVSIESFVDFQVNADRDQLIQVLTNLIQNAQHATTHVEQPSVTLRVDVNDHVWTIDVIDNGAGVPRELQAQLFTPYFTTKESGTGLGLSIAQTIAVEHGGQITYDATDEGGSQFSIELPRVVPRTYET